MPTKLAIVSAAVVAAIAITAVASPADARRRHRHHHYGYGAGGFVAGALLGSALTAPRYYGYYGGSPYYYGGGPYYSDVYAASPDSEEYCMQRFRSYDPRSGTYMGYDGQRHPCP